MKIQRGFTPGPVATQYREPAGEGPFDVNGSPVLTTATLAG